MALFLLSTSVGNLMIAAVNKAMVKPLHATAIQAGAETWVSVDQAKEMVTGQKIDFTGDLGVRMPTPDGKTQPLEGTFLVGEIDSQNRVRLVDAVNRQPVKSIGEFTAGSGEVSTYYLVGPDYFYFFVVVMTIMGVVFIFVARSYQEKVHVRTDVV
jgi:hypothetical protein